MNIVKYELAFLFTWRHLIATVDAITHVYCCVQCRINNSSVSNSGQNFSSFFFWFWNRMRFWAI